MSELTDQLRLYADMLDKGDPISNATNVAIVVANEDKLVSATFIGNRHPAMVAGIDLLAAGIARMNGMKTEQPKPEAKMPPALFSASRGSTH